MRMGPVGTSCMHCTTKLLASSRPEGHVCGAACVERAERVAVWPPVWPPLCGTSHGHNACTRVVLCEGEAEEEAPAEPMRTKDKEDPWAEANLLHGLTAARERQLRALPPPPPAPGAVLAAEATLDRAVNPWLSPHAPLAWPDEVDHGQVGSIQGAEHNAQRSLMHRCGSPHASPPGRLSQVSVVS